MELGIYSLVDVQIDPTTGKRGSTARAQRNLLDDQPGMYVMHILSNHNAEKLANGLRAGLEKVAIK